MSASLTIAGQEIADVTVYDVSVVCGRDDVESQPDAAVLNATITDYRRIGAVGTPIVLADALGVLFHGVITDLDADMLVESTDAAGHATLSWSTALTATGPLAALGHVYVGDSDYPQETDSQRVRRILDEAGASSAVDTGIVGPQILPRVAESGDAASLARAAADDGMGVLWEQPSDTALPIRYTPQRLRTFGSYTLAWGELQDTWERLAADVTWQDMNSDHVTGPPSFPPALELDASLVLASLTFTQAIGDLAASHVVVYGPEVEQGERAEITAGDGYPQQRHDTQLATSSDAAAYATTMLRRHIEPAWRLKSLTIPLHRLQPAEQQRIRDALATGTRITLEIPQGSPVGYGWQGFLEGWEHALTDGAHTLTLSISDRSLTEPADRWQDIPSDLAWDGLPSDMQWVDAVNWSATS